MKKLFLIPLMALFSCVMAWADPVTTLEELQAALNAGGEVTLGANINAGATSVTFSSGTATLDLGEFSLSSSVSASGATANGTLIVSGGSLTIKGSGSIAGANGNAIYMSAGSLTIKSGSFSGGNEGIFASGGSITIEGGTFNGPNDNAIWSRGSALTITGGTFTGGWGAIQADDNCVLTISGGDFTGVDQEIALGAWNSISSPNPVGNISGGTFNGNGLLIYSSGTYNVTGGSYVSNPVAYVDLTSYIVLHPEKYVVTTPAADVVAYNPTLAIAYTSLAEAVEAASAGNNIYMYKNDLAAVTVDKNLTIHAQGFSSNLTAGAGYSRADMGQNVIFTNNAIAAFLMADGTNSMTIDADADIASAGVIFVNGDKTLTINEGVTVTYQRMTGDYVDNICIPAGAKLTILGNGTFSGNNRAIATYGGELVIGPQDQSTQPHFVSTRTDGGCIIESAGGTVTINNIDVYAACIALWVEGEGARMIVNGGRIEADGAQTVDARNGGYYEQNGGTLINNTSTKHGIYSYALMAAANGTMVLNGGSVSGVHGGINASYSGAHVTIYGGSYETRACSYGGASHYAVYVSDYGVVDVRGGDFKSYDKTSMLCGNNDAHRELGVINIYGGRMATKATVQKVPTNNTFPASIPLTSQWYSSITVGSGNYGQVPLPAGYEYYETGDETYPWGVQAVAGKDVDAIDPAEKAAQEADPTYTIPWQQATTWATDEVPEENTIVTIPVGATVTVKNDPTLTDEAVADQVFVAQGATLKVEEGTTLTIGNGGLNIGDGGQLVVEEGAIVTVGDAGIITQDDPSTLVVSATETGSGALLISPAVTENTHPYATVEMYAKAHKDGDTWYAQHFGIPTYNTPVIGWAPGNTWVHKFGENGWENITSLSELQPFVGYKLTNNSPVAAGKYTFTGNIIGNGNAPISFVKPYYNLLANSYTAPMSLAALFTNIEAQYGNDVDLTVWIYKSDEDRHVSVTKAAVLSGEDPEAITTIAPMQGFILYCGPTQPADGEINYAQAIWNNTDKTGVPIMAPARDAQDESVHATIVVTSEKSKDEVVLRENNEYSNAFDNGADARKYMSERVFDFYSVNNGEAFSQVATDDLAGTELTMKAKDETVYTMSFRNVNNFDYEIRDNLSGAIIPVVEGTTYEFTMAEGNTAEARFEVIGIAKTPTAIENVDAVKAAKGIYTVLGQYLGESSILNTLPTGIYVVDGQRIVK